MKDTIYNRNKEINQLRTRIDEKSQKINEINSENLLLRDKVTQCKKETRTARENIHILEGQLNDLRSLIESSKNDQKEIERLRSKILELSGEISVDNPFPSNEDIIKQYKDLYYSQYTNIQSKMQTKMEEYINKNELNISKHFLNKKIRNILFDVLIKSYNLCTEYIKSHYHELSKLFFTEDLNLLERKFHAELLRNYKSVFENYANEIYKNELHKLLIPIDTINYEYDNECMKYFEKYCMKCVLVCSMILLTRNDKLALYPNKFEPKELFNVDKNDDGFTYFNKKNFISGNIDDSPTTRLNYICWPALFIKESKKQCSKYITYFANEIKQTKTNKSKKKKKNVKFMTKIIIK